MASIDSKMYDIVFYIELKGGLLFSCYFSIDRLNYWRCLSPLSSSYEKASLRLSHLGELNMS